MLDKIFEIYLANVGEDSAAVDFSQFPLRVEIDTTRKNIAKGIFELAALISDSSPLKSEDVVRHLVHHFVESEFQCKPGDIVLAPDLRYGVCMPYGLIAFKDSVEMARGVPTGWSTLEVYRTTHYARLERVVGVTPKGLLCFLNRTLTFEEAAQCMEAFHDK